MNANVKTLLKQHILTILCAAALLALFLPFFSATAKMQVLGQEQSSTATTTGFTAVTNVFLGWGLVIGPVLLVAMNYVKKLEKYKGLLAIVVPVVCIVIEIITYFMAQGAGVKAAGGGGIASAETNFSFGIGFFLLIVIYLGMIAAGAVFYHNFTLDKAGLERLKTEGAGMFSEGLKNVKESGEKMMQSAGQKIASMQSDTSADPSGSPTKKPLDRKKTEDVLLLIEKLAAMKESGILTEEEFSEKKQELLKEI